MNKEKAPLKDSGPDRVQILLPLPFNHGFDYEVPSSMALERGDVVQVPFGRRIVFGVVWQTEELPPLKPGIQLKAILEKHEGIKVPGAHLDFIKWVAGYTLAPLGAVLKMSLSVPSVFDPPKKRKTKTLLGDALRWDYAPPILSEAQKAGAETLCETLDHQAPSVTLLEGVTGSGKTEVYFEAIAAALRQGKQGLVMLPEIALTPQLKARFEGRFGGAPTLWHSDVTPARKREAWRQVVSGEAKVIVGARSALFLPYSNLGLIVVDEEHEQAYKQEEGVMYQGRDMAVLRAHLGKIPCVLVSATPSLETLLNCEQGRYKHVKLEDRYKKASLPTVEVISMRAQKKISEKAKESEAPGKKWISLGLSKGIQETLERREQGLLFLNRRGYAPLTLCGACGDRLQCPDCSVWLVEHRSSGHLLCHHCGYTLKKPRACPKCEEEDTLIPCGPGVERLEEEVHQRFPEARTLVMASDRLQGPNALSEALQKITNHEVDLIIGTQMMAKGHHFPLLTLVGVIDADLGLSGGDLRACERTYQLLHQVAGRSGRAERPGHVFLQTFYPDHPVMEALASGAHGAFFAQEKEMRERIGMPPFGRLISLILSGFNGDEVERLARSLVAQAPQYKDVEVLGPAPAPLAIVRRRHRWRVLVKSPKTVNLQEVVREWLRDLKIPQNLRLQIDVDPYSFL